MCDSPAQDPKVAIAKLLQPDIVIMVFLCLRLPLPRGIRKQPAQASSHRALPLLNFWQALRSLQLDCWSGCCLLQLVFPYTLQPLAVFLPLLKMQPGSGDRKLRFSRSPAGCHVEWVEQGSGRKASGCLCSQLKLQKLLCILWVFG